MSLLGKTEHEWAEESLSAYLDGELTPAETARVEAHLQECRTCRANLATLRQTVGLLGELPMLRAPRSFAVRPVVVTAKRAAPARSWGYGLLKGATAMAALVLLLLVGGDLALTFVAPSVTFTGAPAPEAAWAPTLEPALEPAPSEEQPLLGTAKETESTPADLEEMAPAVPEPTAAADVYQTVPPEGTPPAAVGGGEPATAPTAAPTEAPVEERLPLVAGGGEATPTASGTPVPAAAEDGQRQAVSLPTPEIIAMAEGAEPAEAEQARGEAVSPAWALSPLRLAELVILVILLVLAVATALTAWRRRRATS
jgi:hypothetical protein